MAHAEKVMPTQSEIEAQLSQLQQMIGCDGMDVRVVGNLPPYRTIWQLRNKWVQGQVEARFGSQYSDEPDGFACYLEGYGWTDYLPTVEECAQQHEDRKCTF